MMTRFHRSFAAALCASLLAGPLLAQSALERASPESVGMSTERLARLKTVIGEYARDNKHAGAVTLVARKGKIVHLEASGQRDREARAPMQTDTIFRIASQTKGIVSVGVMMLVEQGKLRLNDPLSRFFPEFRDSKVAVPREGGGVEMVKARRPIVIRDLLTHTSGLGYGRGPGAAEWEKAGIQDWYFAHRDEPVAATVARMGALPLDAQPGERWVYGYSIDVLGAVIEKASGQSLDEYLRRNIFEPLGMKDTAFYLQPARRDRLAAVYSRSPTGELTRAPVTGTMQSQGAYVEGPRKSFSGGAGLTSTAEDYARVLQMMLNGGELNGRRLLSRKTVELMTVDHLGEVTFRPGAGMGLGFSVVKDLGLSGQLGSVGEFGWGGAYHTTYWADPKEQLVVVYLTQLLPAGDIDDFDKLRALVYQAIVD